MLIVTLNSQHPFEVATWDEFTAALAAGEDWIKLTDNISNATSYDLKINVKLDLGGKSLEISNPELMLNIFSTATIKNGTIKGKVYARTNSNIMFDGVTFGGTIKFKSTEASLQIQNNCVVYAKNCTFNATASGNQTRPLSTEYGNKIGDYKFENCSFKSNNNQGQVYVNYMNGPIKVNFTGCSFKNAFGWNKAANIDMNSSYSLSNLTLKNNTGGFTITLNRASTSLTEEDLAIYKAIKDNNNGTKRFIFTDGEKNNL